MQFSHSSSTAKMFAAILLVLLGVASVKSEDGAAVYTRWGRNDCPYGNEMVYRGYAAGSSWTEQGGSAQLICLPEDPIYLRSTSGFQGYSYIYATEYESEQAQPAVSSLNDHDMPCAVCMKQEHKTTLMVPARSQCYDGWTLQYYGYLWGGGTNRDNNKYAPKDYICVDVNPQSAGGRHRGGLRKASMYVVEASCGSGQGPLPCPPYVNGWELTCAVCTR